MKLENIFVGNRNYQIFSLNDEDFDSILFKKNLHNSEIKSFIDYDEQVICVRNKLKIDHRQELILHELLHACAEDSGFDQDEKFELFIRSFAPRLSSLLSSGLQNVINNV